MCHHVNASSIKYLRCNDVFIFVRSSLHVWVDSDLSQIRTADIKHVRKFIYHFKSKMT